MILAGLAVVAGPGLLAGGGGSLFLAAGLMWAVFTVLSKRWGVGPLEGTAVVSVLSAAAVLSAACAATGFAGILVPPAPALAAQLVVQGALSGVAAVVAFAAAVRWLGASHAAAFPALMPVSATLAGIPIAGEWPDAAQVAGLGLVVAGLAFAVGLVAPKQRARG